MNLKKLNKMPPDLQEIMQSAAKVHKLDFTARTIRQDGAARQILAEKGMETLTMPEDELRKAEKWCWNRFLQEKGKDKYVDRLIEVFIKARKMHKAYFGPKRLPT